MRSVRKDFFLHVPNDSRETTHGRAFSYRAFVPKGRRVVLARSLVGGRSFTRSKARGRTRHARATRGPRGGALDRSGIVLPHRDELPARARPRVQPVRVSSTRSSPERRDDARRRDACIIDEMKTSYHPLIDDEHTPPHPCARSRVNETTARTNERATDGTSTSRASTR